MEHEPTMTTKAKAPVTKIPRFKNESEEADWWSSKQGRAYTHGQFKEAAAKGTLRRGIHPAALEALTAAGRTVPVNIRFSAEDIRKARELAHKKGIGYQTVIKMLVHEGLSKES
jgi:hypothetical protein